MGSRRLFAQVWWVFSLGKTYTQRKTIEWTLQVLILQSWSNVVEYFVEVLNDRNTNSLVLFAADSTYVGTKGTVIGWGRLGERKKSSNILQKVDVPIISNEDCKDMGYAADKITSNMICAGYKEGEQDACQVFISICNIIFIRASLFKINKQIGVLWSFFRAAFEIYWKFTPISTY